MKSVTVGQLRQNPTQALDEVASGETYRITRHGHEIGRIVPPGAATHIEPPKRATGSTASALPRLALRSAESIDALLAESKGEW